MHTIICEAWLTKGSQALKCNSNACPSGVATQNPELTAGLVPEDKALRVYRYHHATVSAALEIVGAMGLRSPAEVSAAHVMRRVSATSALSFAELHPPVDPGCLLRGEGPPRCRWRGMRRVTG